jgi:hypothetical protein
MVDNIVTNPAADGALIATKDDGVAHHQKVLAEFSDVAGDPALVTSRSGLPITPADGQSVDGFGRFRVSEPTTLFNNKQLWDSNPLFWDDRETDGAGTSSAHSTAIASTTMSTSLNTAGTRVRQTFQRFNYQPGKSQLAILTGKFGTAVAGITRRMGLYDDNDGLFFSQEGATFNVVIRSSTSGSPVDDAVPQASWNLDVMDGTGPSGVTLDLSKKQVLMIDYQWLGNGRVRFGIYIAGRIVYVHEFLRENVLTVPYMSTPNLPLRYEITSDGASPVSSLVHTCVSVMAEGGAEGGGLVQPLSSGTTAVSASVIGTVYAVVGASLKATHFDAATEVENIEMLISAGSNALGEWLLIHNPVVADTFTYSDVTNSPYQRAIGVAANTVTGGQIIDGGYVLPSKQGSSAFKKVPSALALGSSIAGVSDTLVLCFMPLTTNVSVHGILTMRERF